MIDLIEQLQKSLKGYPTGCEQSVLWKKAAAALEAKDKRIAELEAKGLEVCAAFSKEMAEAEAEIAKRMGHRPDVAFAAVAKLEAENVARLEAENKELRRLNGVLAHTFSDLQHSADKEIERLQEQLALERDLTNRAERVATELLEKDDE